jgi:hypothetical protein
MKATTSPNQQTLVAYDDTLAAYVTLVSTGVDCLLGPATAKSTKTGVSHIASKHLVEYELRSHLGTVLPGGVRAARRLLA